MYCDTSARRSPLSIALRHQSNGEGDRVVFCVVRHSKGFPHLGTCLPVLPALQSLPPHSHSVGRLYTAGSPFSACPHRPRGAPSDVRGLYVLPYCSRQFHPLARSRPHPGHHSRYCGTRPTDRLDIPLRLPADHHRIGALVCIPTSPILGRATWHSALMDDRPPPRG
jgi:hypothetical protein